MKIKRKLVVSVGVVVAGAALYEAGSFFPQYSVSPVFAASSVVSPPPMAPVGLGEPADLNIFVSLAKKAIPSVVNISTLTTVKAAYHGSGNGSDAEDLFRQFFGGGGGPFGQGPGRPGFGQPKIPKSAALGSGFVINSSGIILTNNHVVNGADEIKVYFTENPEEKPVDGKVVGRDPELDVALIQVKTPNKLVPLILGDSEALQVGEYVMAVGNPYGNGHSVSHGIVSAKGRMSPGVPLASYLQIDAPINPGNSGGPLLNLRGEVVGINNAIDARAQGIGFAIPINYVKKVLAQLETRGSVERGYIGAMVGPLNAEIAEKVGAPKDLRAPFITQINPGTTAEKAGLQPYDVVTEVDGTPVHSPSDLIAAVTSVPVGKSVPM
jgi:serine protease Do